MSEAKIIDRIKKLLSLAESKNEHEAALAAAQAAELMQKHEIAEAQLAGDEASEEIDTTSIDESGKLVNWKAYIAGGLAQSFGCFFFLGRGRKNGKATTTYKIVGQPSKVATIQYMYSYLLAEVDRLADIAYRQEHIECRRSGVDAPSPRGWKNAFRLGAAGTISKRLKEQRKKTHAKAEAAGQSQALVVVRKNEEAIQTYVKEKYPRLGNTATASYSSRSGYGAGKAAGRNVSLGGSNGKLGAGAKQLGSGG